MKKTQEHNELEAMEMVKIKSERAMNEAFNILDGLKEGQLSLADATEMSNAVGKANAAIGNVIKAELLCLAMTKQSTDYARQKLAM